MFDQRTVSYETYVMPAPEEDHARFYEHLLRRNRHFHGAAFCIGDEDAVSRAVAIAREASEIRRGDLVAVLSGSKDYPGQATDTLRLIPIR